MLRQQALYNSGSNAFDPKKKDLLVDDLRPSKDASLDFFEIENFRKISKIFIENYMKMKFFEIGKFRFLSQKFSKFSLKNV